MTGLLVLAAVLVAATAFGLWRARTDGRMRAVESARTGQDEEPGSALVLTANDLRAPLGERATLVHFSTAFCAPCRTARQVLGGVADEVAGVNHVEVDAESRLDLVRRLDVSRTPTILVLDADGRVVRRATGAPRRADVVAALGTAGS